MAARPPDVVPRWEWRVFGDRFPEVDAHLSTAGADETSSAETYVVGPSDDVNVKIRRGQLDVKRRLAVTDGLERWSPVLKAAFPIDGGVIAAVFRLWGLAVPIAADRLYTAEQFLEEFVVPCDRVRMARVRKVRRQASRAGCVVERAALDIDGQVLQTAAVESEDPDQAHHLARALGLTDRDNVNYVAALRRLLRVDHRTCAHGSREGAPS